MVRQVDHTISKLHWDMEHALDCVALLAFLYYLKKIKEGGGDISYQ